MKRTLLTSTACLALIMGPIAPSLAQDQAPAAEEPAVILPSDDAATGNDTMTGQAEEVAPAMKKDLTATAKVESDGMFFVYEEDNQFRSTELVGHTVVNAQDETLGDINDLVISSEGELEGVIIGVGGFLGLGEKDVGIRYEALTVTENVEAGDITLTLDMTREQLENAPEFVTVEEQAAAEQRKRDMEEMGATPGLDNGTTSALPAPAPQDETAAPVE
ncbi:PRC-barrel domain-containing protein [Oricola sp.]|uniref:PRC-barrel domain-containing protein n=1 Tax=Oricola sp. TaxID=1979950 RepID=UPI0026006096|nr:PRC-barrel domain-containing protein [Oricola sp.]MCI5075737.1 PRC-barrel domain-containing protein [Oricola sp.]